MLVLLHFSYRVMQCRLVLASLFGLLCYGGVQAICPNGSSALDDPPLPLYFGFMTAVDKASDYVLSGVIPSVDLALELINNSTAILPGYNLSYNGIVYDSAVSCWNCYCVNCNAMNVWLLDKVE